MGSVRRNKKLENLRIMRIIEKIIPDYLVKSPLNNPVFWGGLTIIVGIIGLLGWSMGSRFLITIIPKSITMAPASAFLFILLGICMIISKFIDSEPDCSILFDILLIPPIIIGFWVLFNFHSEYPYAFSWSSYSDYKIFLVSPESQVSLMSAILFPAISMGVFFSRYVTKYSSLIFIGVMACSLLFMSGYFLGNPLFYEESVKPISFMSALGFFLSSAGFWLSMKRRKKHEYLLPIDT